MAIQSMTDVALLVYVSGVSGTADTQAVSDEHGEQQQIAVERQTIAIVQTKARENSELSREHLDKVVSQLKEYVQSMQRDIDFRVDDVTGRFVVKVVDSISNEVIRQIPQEEMLTIAHHLAEVIQQNESRGNFIEIKA